MRGKHGIEPAPKRKRTGSWKTFLKAHWDVLAAIDFTTVEVWTKTGLTTFYLLFVMEVKTRRVHFAGCMANPTEEWMQQAGREPHYHTERNHQGLGNRLIIPLERPPDVDAPVETTERLGGMLRSYRRAA